MLVFELTLFTVYSVLVREFDPFHLWLLLGALVVLASSIVVALLGGSIGASVVGLAMSPVVIVVGYELVGHRHEEEVLRRNGALA